MTAQIQSLMEENIMLKDNVKNNHNLYKYTAAYTWLY